MALVQTGAFLFAALASAVPEADASEMFFHAGGGFGVLPALSAHYGVPERDEYAGGVNLKFFPLSQTYALRLDTGVGMDRKDGRLMSRRYAVGISEIYGIPWGFAGARLMIVTQAPVSIETETNFLPGRCTGPEFTWNFIVLEGSVGLMRCSHPTALRPILSAGMGI